MQTVAQIESWLEDWTIEETASLGAAARHAFLERAEEVLENWLVAHDQVPTAECREGFRLLGLHRQAAKGEPSFNACRETCREIAYRFNLAGTDLAPDEWRSNLATLRRVVQHLTYFVGGKMRNAQLGEFCCAARPVRTGAVLDG